MDNILNLEKNILENAKISACRIDDKELRIKAYALNIAANATAQFLDKMGLESDTSLSLYKIPSFEKEFELADVYVDGFRFDTRISFDGQTFAVPKTHTKYGATPLAYIVIKLDQNINTAEFLGFVGTEGLALPDSTTEYHTLSTDILRPMTEIKDLLEASTLSIHPYSATTHEKIKELSAAFIDNEITESEKVFLIKHVVTCPVCRETFCDINDFDTIVSHIKNYKELLNDSTLSVLSGNKKELDEAALANMTLVEHAEEDDLDKIEEEQIFSTDIVEEDTDLTEETTNSDELILDEQNTLPTDESEDLNLNTELLDEEIINNNEQILSKEESLIEEQEEIELQETNIVQDENLQEELFEEPEHLEIIEPEEMFTNESIELNETEDNHHLEELHDTEELLNTDNIELHELSEIENIENLFDTDLITDTENTPLLEEQPIEETSIITEETTLYTPQQPIELNYDDEELTEEPEENNILEENIEEENLQENNDLQEDIPLFEEPLNEKDSLERFEKQIEEETETPVEENEEEIEEIPENNDKQEETVLLNEEPLNEKDSLERFEKQIEEEEIAEYQEITETDNNTAVSEDIQTDANAEIQSLLDDDLMALLSEDNDNESSEEAESKEIIQEESITNIEENIENETAEEITEPVAEETIDELFENEEQQTLPKSELAEEPISNDVVKKTKNMAIAAGLLIVLLAASGSMLVFNKQKAINNDIQNNEMFDFQTKAEDEATQAPAVSQDINRSMTNSFSEKPVAITITKLSWQVSEKLALEPSVKEYLQTVGKNIQMNLQNDLANSADIAFNNVVKVSFTIAQDNTLKGLQILESSGSDKIDADISTSIKNTLKYVGVPKLDNYKSDYFLTLIINF